MLDSMLWVKVSYMILKDLIQELERIVMVHPEAGTSNIWAAVSGEDGDVRTFRMAYVRFDRKHHPNRILLEEGL